MPVQQSPCVYLVFVYGTLKRGHSNHHWLAGATFLGRRLLRGGRLYDLGPYPMAVLSTDKQAVIHGELFAVTQEGLARLDLLEGYPSFYERSQLILSTGQTAWVYHGLQEQVGDAPTIPLGDWGTNPVFHYGSNLDPRRLRERCPDWDEIGVVVELMDWSWAIDKRAYDSPIHGYAGIRPRPGSSTWGVMTNLSDAAIAELDWREGVAYGHYTKEIVAVRSHCGLMFDALVYVPAPRHRKDGLIATDAYRRHILEGLDHWELPAAWRNTLASSLSTTT